MGPRWGDGRKHSTCSSVELYLSKLGTFVILLKIKHKGLYSKYCFTHIHTHTHTHTHTHQKQPSTRISLCFCWGQAPRPSGPPSRTASLLHHVASASLSLVESLSPRGAELSTAASYVVFFHRLQDPVPSRSCMFVGCRCLLPPCMTVTASWCSEGTLLVAVLRDCGG